MSKYKVLARAFPNPLYLNHRNVKDMVLEARLVGGQVRYYETHPNTTKREYCLTEARVKSLFPVGKLKADQPFSHNASKANKEFYAVLFKHRKRYAQQVAELKNNVEAPDELAIRTKHKH